MRFIILVKTRPDNEAHIANDAQLAAAMLRYHEDLARAGVLLDAAVLQPSNCGWRMRLGIGRRSVEHGPFAANADLVAGYTLIQVRTPDEAMEWARRFPAPDGMQAGEIEVRPLQELPDGGGRAPAQAMAPARLVRT